jgi:hypothetical protein
MKLTELEPRWYEDENGNLGMSFLCPCCRDKRLAVLVNSAVPRIGKKPFPYASNINQRQCWQISGEIPSFDGLNHGGFERVTLTPSVDASTFGHWHGYITNGEVN